MKALVGAMVCALLLLTLGRPPAAAAQNCRWVSSQSWVKGKLTVISTWKCGPASSVPGAAGPSSETPSPISPACRRVEKELKLPATACGEAQSAKSLGGPRVTAPMIAAAVWRLRLPPSVLHIQPVKGKTLVNFATNFYATNSPIERSIRLLGQRIRVRVWADRYTWVFGDGSRRSTTSPGAAYPDLLVTHKYLRKGVVRPSVSTRYVAQYRLGNGAWSDVPGSATIPTAAHRLRVVTATPVLTGDG